jgi:hypothetical protein
MHKQDVGKFQLLVFSRKLYLHFEICFMKGLHQNYKTNVLFKTLLNLIFIGIK